MNIAILFNSDDPKYRGVYGWAIRDRILSTEILQESNRHIKISVGDVLILSHAKTQGEFIQLCELTYFWHPWQLLLSEKLRSTYLKVTVFAWVVQNTTAIIAKRLHQSLLNDSAYLGMHAVEFSYPLHLVLYRNSMSPTYRMQGRTCNIFSSMSDEDSKVDSEMEEVQQLGFDNVIWEDYGAHQTIFDDFDTLEHFQQVKDFCETIVPYFDGGEDEVGELVMIMEDLNPQLFDVLGSAVRTLTKAQTVEDIAQVGLSGRRYFVKLADVLFPARKDLYNGREVSSDKYRNRLWAFLSDSILPNDPDRDVKINAMGKEIDRLDKEFNSTLHGDPNREKIINSLGSLAKLSVALLSLNPESARKPYYAFEKNIMRFVSDLIKESPPAKE